MEGNGVETKPVVYLTTAEAAAKLGVCKKTVARAARRAGLGVFVAGGRRLAALHPADVAKMRGVIHETPGNPAWIAAARPRKRP
jgi:hypothetical protein